MFDFKDDDRFLARWLNGELSEEELRAFEASDDYAVYKNIIEGADSLIRPEFINPNLLDEIKKAPKEISQRKQVSKLWYYGIAASVIILMGLFGFYRLSEVTITPGYGEQASVTLPDGSSMMVNARSTASYNSLTWSFNRKINLEGEAYFKVTKGDQFTVNTIKGDVQVLGTEFNVFVDESFLEVTCYEGKVSVNTSKENIVDAGKAYRSINNEEIISEQSDDQPGWVTRQSTFRSVPIKYVLKALENQYGIAFEGNLPEDDLVFSGSFPHNNKELALKLVFGSLQIDYNFKGEKTVVLEN